MKNACLLSLALVFFNINLLCQPLTTSLNNTYAVVVGISDYQHLPDLRFADKDALAFAEWLQSSAGGNLPKEQIQILLNEEATGGSVNMAMYWLLEKCQSGDQAVIYFSGHGDIEQKLVDQLGFLLCWDAMNFMYMAGNNLQVSNLQSVVNTLTTSNKAEVLLITDACRAGKLAGTPIGGTGITTANIAQVQNAIKILSCQSNEFSLEGIQWGGGRGAFSYHLVEGLYGLADHDKDLKIKLKEIDRYLEDQVPQETAPQTQNPIAMGNKEALLAMVDQGLLAQKLEEKKQQLQPFSPGAKRGMEELIFAHADSSIQEIYNAFLAAIDSDHLMFPEAGSANALYEVLIKESGIKEMHGFLIRSFVAALMDDAQQAINDYLESDSTELAHRFNNDAKYKLYPDYLERATELLGKEHYMYKPLKSKQSYFQGLVWRLEADQINDDSLYSLALEQQIKTQSLADWVPYSYLEAGMIYKRRGDFDTAKKYFLKASDQAPNWAIPYAGLSDALNMLYMHLPAVKYAEKAIKLDSNNYWVYETLIDLYFYLDNIDKGEKYLNKALEIWKEYIPALVVSGWVQLKKGNEEKAEQFFEKAIQILPKRSYTYQRIGEFYRREGYPYKAIPLNDKVVELNPENIKILIQAHSFYKNLGEHEKADQLIQKIISIQLQTLSDRIALGFFFYHLNKKEEAKNEFKKILTIQQNHILALESLAYMYYTQDSLDKSEEYNQMALTHHPNFLDAIKNAALIALKRGNLQTAEIQLEKIIELNPNYKWSYIRLQLAKVYHQTGQFKERDDILKSGMKLYPKNTHYLRHVGNYYGQIKEPQKALEIFQKAIKLKPDDPGNDYNICCAFALVNDKDTALDWFEKALEKGFNDHTKIQKDTDLDNIRDTKRFKKLVRKYLAEGSKNKTQK